MDYSWIKVVGFQGEILFEGFATAHVQSKFPPPSPGSGISIGEVASTVTITLDTPYPNYHDKMKHVKVQDKINKMLTPTKLTPILPKKKDIPKERLAEILEAAADRLLVDGWVKGTEHLSKGMMSQVTAHDELLKCHYNSTDSVADLFAPPKEKKKK